MTFQLRSPKSIEIKPELATRQSRCSMPQPLSPYRNSSSMHSIRSNHCHRHRFPIHPHPAGVQIFLALPVTKPPLDRPHQSAFSSRPRSPSLACEPWFLASSLYQSRSQKDLSPIPMTPESLARRVLNPFGISSKAELWPLPEMFLIKWLPAWLQTDEASVQGSSSAMP